MASLAIKEISSNRCFSGIQKVYSHESSELKCRMNFGIYLPPKAKLQKLPVLYWLSGLTCTEQNFITKAGAQQYASQHNVVVVAPDTSPRNCGIEGEDDSWDFGTGAGFYVDATEDKWKNNYRMYSYITRELPQIISANFDVSEKKSIFGHSMGGHGALICALKNPGFYQSVSAFSPICNPMQGPWGQKALSGYLGNDTTTWKDYDATELVKTYNGPTLDILIDTGLDDQFLKDKQLLPENFEKAAAGNPKVKLANRLQEGYDHSYYFISSFIQDHFTHHIKFLS